MTDFRELGKKEILKRNGLEDEDFEVIGKIYSLAGDS